MTATLSHQHFFGTPSPDCQLRDTILRNRMKKKRWNKFEPRGYKLRTKHSRTGIGLFTEETIPKGACIIEYTGRKVGKKEQYENRGKYLFETGKGTMIDGNIKTNLARYINHSCGPNCEIDIRKRRVYVFAKRNIKAGEELSYDYDTEYFDMFIKPKGCLCNRCKRKRKKK